MSITIRQIRYFVSTAELGQVSHAATKLSISQSAITTAIKDLEYSLGTRLFVRNSQGMELTSSGRQFLSYAYDILNKINEALAVAHNTEEIVATLNVAATYTVLGYFLPHHLDLLSRIFPHLRVNVFDMSREEIEEGLISKRYDIAVFLTSNIINSDIATETLLSSKRRLWLPAKHKLLAYENVSLKEVAEEPYIMLTMDEAAETTMRYWTETAFRPNVRYMISSLEAIRSMVANGHGVTILSDMVHRPWSLESKRIETVVPLDHIPPMDIGMAWPRSAEFTPAMQAFRNYFRRTFAIAQHPLSEPVEQ